MPLPKARMWKQGDPFSASHMNETTGIANALFPLTGGNVSVVTGLNGTSLNARPTQNGGGTLPVPQYQFMILQGGIGNKIVADWFRGSPTP